jgi:HlyD family secretion protein
MEQQMRTSPPVPVRASKGALVIDPRLGAIRTAPPLRIATDIRGPFRFGLILIVLLFGVVGTWAATAQLSGAVIANGAISPEGSRQTVQHLEGGIIRTILARDGDRVAKGDELIVIEDLPRQADLAALRSQLFSLAAQQQRLVAERAPWSWCSTIPSSPTAPTGR